MTEYARICYEFGGSVHTAWAEQSELTVDSDETLTYIDVETGCGKIVPSHVPYVVTERVALPPEVVPWDTEDQSDG